MTPPSFQGCEEANRSNPRHDVGLPLLIPFAIAPKANVRHAVSLTGSRNKMSANRRLAPSILLCNGEEGKFE
jgi:hypothetical protein